MFLFRIHTAAFYRQLFVLSTPHSFREYSGYAQWINAEIPEYKYISPYDRTNAPPKPVNHIFLTLIHHDIQNL